MAAVSLQWLFILCGKDLYIQYFEPKTFVSFIIKNYT